MPDLKEDIKKKAEKGKTFLNKEYTEEENIKHKQILLGFIMFSPITIAFDLTMSYLAYTRNTLYFINNEASYETIQFFTNGNIPHIWIIGNLFGIFLMIFGYILLKNKKMKFVSNGYIYLAIGFLLNAGHIYGGISWIPILIG